MRLQSKSNIHLVGGTDRNNKCNATNDKFYILLINGICNL